MVKEYSLSFYVFRNYKRGAGRGGGNQKKINTTFEDRKSKNFHRGKRGLSGKGAALVFRLLVKHCFKTSGTLSGAS